MTINLETLSRNMKYLRLSRRLSQETLSADINLTRTTYVAFENGKKAPDLQTLDALAGFYGLSFDSLVNYDLTQGLMNRIYFAKENKELAELLNDYQALSVSSKYLLVQRMDVLLDTESSLYSDHVRVPYGLKKVSGK